MNLKMGGATAGAVSVKSFDFKAATSANELAVGLPFYVPQVGEVLIDAWIEVITAWAATAIGDFGNYIGTNTGFFLTGFPGVDMTTPGAQNQQDALAANLSFVDAAVTGIIEGALQTLPNPNPTTLELVTGVPALAGSFAPVRFLASHPLLVVVSDDGTNTGNPVGGVGEGRIYIETCVPPVEFLT